MSARQLRKLRRIEDTKSLTSTAFQGLAQVGDLTSKIDQFLSAVQQMQNLAEKIDESGEIMQVAKQAQEAVESVQTSLLHLGLRQEIHQRVLIRILYYFKQFFTESSSISSELGVLEAELTHKADESE